MSMVQLARLRDSCVKGHHIYRTHFVVGALFVCEREPGNYHSDWTIMVRKRSGEIVGHVPDDLAQVLFPLRTSGTLQLLECELTEMRKAAEEGVWVQGGGIVIPCTYILYGKKEDKVYIRKEMRKNSKSKGSKKR